MNLVVIGLAASLPGLVRFENILNDVIGEYQCEFRRNSTTVNHIFSIRQILEKKWEYNKDVCQLFIDFEEAYDSIKRESLYDILIKFGVPQKLVRLIKICLDGTQSKVRIGNYLTSSFPIGAMGRLDKSMFEGILYEVDKSEIPL